MMFLCLKSFNAILIQMDKLKMFNEDCKALNNQVTDYLSQLISHGSSQCFKQNPTRIPRIDPVLSLLLHILFSFLKILCLAPHISHFTLAIYPFDWVVNSYLFQKTHHWCYLFESFSDNAPGQARKWEIIPYIHNLLQIIPSRQT